MILRIRDGEEWGYFVSDESKIMIASDLFGGFGDVFFSWILTESKKNDVEVIDFQDKNGKRTKVIK